MPSNRGQKEKKLKQQAPTVPPVVSGLMEMLGELHRRCPVLCPAVVPNGLADAEQGVALLALCTSAEEKRAFATMLQSVRAKVKTCALTGQVVTDQSSLRFVSSWGLDPKAGTYTLQRCTFASAEAAQLLDTAAMLERFTRESADYKELGRLAQLFSEVNAEGGEARSGLEARLWLQECLALACSCQVLASSLPKWQALCPDGTPCRKGVGVLALAKRAMNGSSEEAAMNSVSADEKDGGEEEEPKARKVSDKPSRKARQRQAAAAASAAERDAANGTGDEDGEQAEAAPPSKKKRIRN